MVEGGPKGKPPNETVPATGKPFGGLDALLAAATGQTDESMEDKNTADAEPAKTKKAAGKGRKTGFKKVKLGLTDASAGPEGESKAARLERLLTEPVLEGAGGTAEARQKFFDHRDPDYALRNPDTEKERVSFAEARNLLVEVMKEQGYSEKAIFHSVGVHVTPLVKRNGQLTAGLMAKSGEKPDGFDEQQWKVAQRLTQQEILVTLRSIFKYPETYEIDKGPDVDVSPITKAEIEERLQPDKFWIDPLMKNGEHPDPEELKQIMLEILRERMGPADEAQEQALEYFAAAYVTPLMQRLSNAERTRRSDGKRPEARHQRLRSAQSLIADFLREILQEKGHNKYIDAMEKSSTAELPAHLAEVFWKIDERAPVFLGHDTDEDRQKRREWADLRVERFSEEEIEEMVDAIKYPDQEYRDPWNDERGRSRPIMIVRAMLKRRVKPALAKVGIPDDEVDLRINQFLFDELQPVFEAITEAVRSIKELGASNEDRVKLAEHQAAINEQYGHISRLVKRAVLSPSRYFGTQELRSGSEVDLAAFDIDIDAEMVTNLEMYMEFDYTNVLDKEKRIWIFDQFSIAHKSYIEADVLVLVGANTKAEIIGTEPTYQAWSDALEEVRALVYDEAFNEANIDTLKERVRAFLVAKRALEETVLRDYVTDSQSGAQN